ncbi:MAG: response regulator transcription factor [Coriobacteriia bacterium]|nr:response regulator transcription factor [Coriobacteriia bacterium]MBN2840484.1 response regulator transcription factor [Coriobacteriia bacterium]
MTIRVLLADDHAIIRDAITATVGSSREFAFVGQASDGRQAVRLAAELKPDVIVMDIAMPELNGIDATRQILAADPHMRILALSMHTGQQFVTEMLRAGARGYILKDSPLEELELAIRTVAEGRAYLGKGPADAVLDDYVKHLDGRTPTSTSMHRSLTPRERECLQLIGEGWSTKEIAARLSLSPKTVETHRRQIMEKTGIYSLAGLIKYAIREGLTTVD